MTTPVYESIRYWLPLVSGFVMVVGLYRSAKKNISIWAETLFENHLQHIQAATTETVKETKETNKLLNTAAMNIADVKTTLADHNLKEGEVWSGVVKTLALLEDRTIACRTRRSPRKR